MTYASRISLHTALWYLILHASFVLVIRLRDICDGVCSVSVSISGNSVSRPHNTDVYLVPVCYQYAPFVSPIGACHNFLV